MAVDVARKRLFVAEIGNYSLDAVDIAASRQVARLTGLAEPQGMGCARKANLVAVANGGDGRARFFRDLGLTRCAPPRGSEIDCGAHADYQRVFQRCRRLRRRDAGPGIDDVLQVGLQFEPWRQPQAVGGFDDQFALCEG